MDFSEIYHRLSATTPVSVHEGVERSQRSWYDIDVTTKQIIEQIKQLSPREQAEVVRFAYRLDAERQLTGQELSALAKRMVEASDPTEAALVRETIAHGFYGGTPNA